MRQEKYLQPKGWLSFAVRDTKNLCLCFAANILALEKLFSIFKNCIKIYFLKYINFLQARSFQLFKAIPNGSNLEVNVASVKYANT